MVIVEVGKPLSLAMLRREGRREYVCEGLMSLLRSDQWFVVSAGVCLR